MPRRTSPDPLAAAVGDRIRVLREAAGLTLEKLAYESELGSKGHLSSLERGLVVPTVTTLQTLASGLGVLLLDLVTFPEEGDRSALVAMTQALSPDDLASLRKRIERLLRDEVEPTPRIRYPKGDTHVPRAATIQDPRASPYARERTKNHANKKPPR